MKDARATAGCPIERALLVLDGKWSTLIIRELLPGPKRFGELRAALAIGSPKTLTERLRILEHQGVLTRTVRSEEHTSELQSRQYLVCRLLLEKKKRNTQLIDC